MSLQTFHVCHFTRDGSLKPALVIYNIYDHSLSWAGEIGSDDVIESCKHAINDMIHKDLDAISTAYGRLEGVQ